MESKGKLKGVPPENLAELANKGGQKAAAAAHHVSESTVSRALRKAGYEPIIIWRQRPAPSEQLTLESVL